MNILRASLIFLLTITVAFAGGTSTDWVKLRTNANQRIELQGASGQTDLVEATPTGNKGVTIQDGLGRLAFMNDMGTPLHDTTGACFCCS